MITPKQNLADLLQAAVSPHVDDFSGEIRDNIDVVLDEWFDNLDHRLTDLIKDWESRVGNDDKTLYTLGIRRVKDIIRGIDDHPEVP